MTLDDEPDPMAELTALPRELAPPPSLEDRTVTALRNEGLLRAGQPRRHIFQAAAAVLLFVTGLAIGRTTGSTLPVVEEPGAPRFLLLLHGGPSGVSAEAEAALVNEYRAWAIGLRQAGRFVSGERLSDVAAIAPTGTLPQVEDLRGFFLISAANLDDALAMARTCPHARRGGLVVVRPIDPT
jgi:hypothetical protein